MTHLFPVFGLRQIVLRLHKRRSNVPVLVKQIKNLVPFSLFFFTNNQV